MSLSSWLMGASPVRVLCSSLSFLLSPALSSFLMCVCRSVLRWIPEGDPLQISGVLYTSLLSNMLHLNLSVIVFPDSVLSPQLRDTVRLCRGLFLASQLKDSFKVVSWENHKDLFSVFCFLCFLFSVECLSFVGWCPVSWKLLFQVFFFLKQEDKSSPCNIILARSVSLNFISN